ATWWSSATRPTPGSILSSASLPSPAMRSSFPGAPFTSTASHWKSPTSLGPCSAPLARWWCRPTATSSWATTATIARIAAIGGWGLCPGTTSSAARSGATGRFRTCPSSGRPPLFSLSPPARLPEALFSGAVAGSCSPALTVLILPDGGPGVGAGDIISVQPQVSAGQGDYENCDPVCFAQVGIGQL